MEAFFITHDMFNEIRLRDETDRTVLHCDNSRRRSFSVEDGHFSKVVISLMDGQHQFLSRVIVTDNLDFARNDKIEVAAVFLLKKDDLAFGKFLDDED